MKKYTLSMLALSVTLSSGAAFAGIVGDASNKSVDVTFSNASITGHTLTQRTGLEPGNNQGKIIAEGKVTTNTGGYINVEFTDYGAFAGGVTSFSGTAVSTNKVWAILKPVGGNLLRNGTNGAIVIKPDTDGGNDFSYTIDVGSGTAVPADTYKISVKAHRWTE